MEIHQNNEGEYSFKSELLNIANRESIDWETQYMQAEVSYYNLAANVVINIRGEDQVRELMQTLQFGDALLVDVNVISLNREA